VNVRVAGPDDVGAIAALRARWGDDAAPDDPDLQGRLAAWMAAEGDRRTIWLASVDGEPVGLASLFEYLRMPSPSRPDARWGYVGNMFVRAEFRDRGIGAALLKAITDVADARGYARLILRPTPRSIPFYTRAGFLVPDDTAGDDRLLVRPAGG
jgi:GNAT superfamily N-acetyltransferase